MQLSRFDRIVLGVAAVLVAAIAIVVWRGDQVGVNVLRATPADGTPAAASAPIVIEFDQRMDAPSVEASFSVEPNVDGQFAWREQTLTFIPTEHWAQDVTYTVSLHSGARSQLGHELLQDLSFSFEVRQPGFAFLHEDEGGFELWAAADLNAEARQLSDTDGRVFDFAVAVDGEQIVYSVVNDGNGIDLWIVERDGDNARVLLDCGTDRCYAPDWAADGQIAYSRASAPLTPTEPYSPPRTWLLDPANGETIRLYADAQKIGYGPVWSPDATHLAYFDGIQSQIVILDVRSGKEIYVPTRAGVVGSWTPDGSQMLFFDVQMQDNNAVNLIYRAQLDTEDVLPFFDPQPTDANYGNPVVSPDGEWVAIKVRPFESGPGDEVWVMPIDGRFGNVVTNAPDLLFTAMDWDPWSTRLLLSKVSLGVADRAPEVWVWDMETAQMTPLAEDASAAAWLP